MSLKTRLVLSFVAIAILVLAIFGFVAYRIALDSGVRKEVSLFRTLVRQEAELLFSHVADHHSQAYVQSVIKEAGNNRDHLVLLIDRQDRYTPSIPLQAFLGSNYRQFPVEKIIHSPDASGRFRFDGQEFVWASATIEGTPYKLIATQRLQTEVTTFMGSMGARLLATGLVVIWIATWSAILLAANISRRLERKNAILVHQALHDELTDLPNRTLLYDRLEQAIHDGRQNHKPGALLVMDLDRFKDINDTLGHTSGDLLLQQVGSRIRTQIRDSDTVARLGGDEFAVLLPGIDAGQAVRHARNIISILERPIVIEGMYLDTEISIGISLYPDHGEEADTLIRRADVAMYQAKQKSSGCFVYEAESDPYSLRRLSLMGELRHALEHDGLTLHYQPKVDLQTGAVTSAEALLRWTHPQHGFIGPDEFIPLAERSGLIRPLTQWVLNAALRQCHLWRKAGMDLTVAVNFSARNLAESRLPDQVAGLLEAWDLPPSSLVAEITESAIMDDPLHANKILMRLQEIGVRASIDDFGTGYSSLAALGQLPVAEIKIDRSFVTDMLSNPKHEVIVRSTIDLGHNLERAVTAEGVEDADTLEKLRELGCDKAQGFYMSRPLPASELAQWIKANTSEQRNIAPRFAGGHADSA